MDNKQSKYTFLVADDHAFLRQAIVGLIKTTYPGAFILYARSYGELDEIVSGNPAIDLAIIDLFMPPGGGMEAVKDILERHKGLKAALISGLATKAEIDQAIKLGVCGFLSKDVSGDLLIKAIELMLDGGIYIAEAPYSQNEFQAAADPENCNLTDRQFSVICLLAKGLTNKQIARELELSPATVKIHVANSMKRLGAQNRTEVVRIAMRHNLLPDLDDIDRRI